MLLDEFTQRAIEKEVDEIEQESKRHKDQYDHPEQYVDDESMYETTRYLGHLYLYKDLGRITQIKTFSILLELDKKLRERIFNLADKIWEYI